MVRLAASELFAGRNSCGLIAAHGRSRADNPKVGCPEDIVLFVASDEIAMGNRASDDLDAGRIVGPNKSAVGRAASTVAHAKRFTYRCFK